MTRETLSASPPGSLCRIGDGDLFILVRVRVELINLLFVVARLGEGIDGVGRGKRCVLVGVVGHCDGFRARGEAGRTGREEGMKGNREGDVAVRSTDPRRGDPSSFLPLTRGDNWDFNPNNQTRRLKTSFYYEWGELISTNMGRKVHVNKMRRRSRQ